MRWFSEAVLSVERWQPWAADSPEVRQEALQVVGVAQLVLALVSTPHQAAPGRVELRALLLDVVHGLGVGLDQTLSRLPQRVHLGSGAGHIRTCLTSDERRVPDVSLAAR